MCELCVSVCHFYHQGELPSGQVWTGPQYHYLRNAIPSHPPSVKVGGVGVGGGALGRMRWVTVVYAL